MHPYELSQSYTYVFMYIVPKRHNPPSFHLDTRRGLAIIISSNNKGQLPFTDQDADEMVMTLQQFNFDIHQLRNATATSGNICTLLASVSQYLKGYNGPIHNDDGSPKTVIFAFAGHGDRVCDIMGCNHDDDCKHQPKRDVILTDDLNTLMIGEMIIPYLAHKTCVKSIPKLFFFDSCRGKKWSMIMPQARSTEEEIVNYRIDYATIAGRAVQAGWMVNVAQQLRTNDEYFSVVMEKARQYIFEHFKQHQLPDTVTNLLVSPFKLYYKT